MALTIEEKYDEVRQLITMGKEKGYLLYEEGNAGRYLPAIVWVLRRRLLGTNASGRDLLVVVVLLGVDDRRETDLGGARPRAGAGRDHSRPVRGAGREDRAPR